jgi:hypothetical protein
VVGVEQQRIHATFQLTRIEGDPALHRLHQVGRKRGQHRDASTGVEATDDHGKAELAKLGGEIDRAGELVALHANQQHDTAFTRARELGPLRPGLTVRRAGDELFMLNDSTHYLTLVVDLGWSEKACERWAAAGMRHALLG